MWIKIMSCINEFHPIVWDHQKFFALEQLSLFFEVFQENCRCVKNWRRSSFFEKAFFRSSMGEMNRTEWIRLIIFNGNGAKRITKHQTWIVNCNPFYNAGHLQSNRAIIRMGFERIWSMNWIGLSDPFRSCLLQMSESNTRVDWASLVSDSGNLPTR